MNFNAKTQRRKGAEEEKEIFVFFSGLRAFAPLR